MTEPRVAALTTCNIAKDGESISLGFTDAKGNPTSLTLEIGLGWGAGNDSAEAH